MPSVTLRYLSAVLPAACWFLIVVVWVAGAIYNRHHAPPVRIWRLQYNPVLIVVLLVAVASSIAPRDLWDHVRFSNPVLVEAGAALLIVSTAFTLWARWVLGTMWTYNPVIKVGHELRTSGPYAITRNPIYTGMLGMLAGTALVNGVGPWALYFAIAVALTEVKIAQEESLLRESFGERYAAYRQRVPQLIPGLSPRRSSQRPAHQP